MHDAPDNTRDLENVKGQNHTAKNRHYFSPALRFLLVILPISTAIALPFISGCTASEDGELETRIERKLAGHQYTEALELLHASEYPEEDIIAMEIRARLAYANYLTHHADHLAMGERMADALRNYRRVLELEPSNSIAHTHIELIEGIYHQMDRPVPEGVAR